MGLILASFVLGLPFPTMPLQISWLTLVMVNIPAILITLGLLHPVYLRDFQRDVLRYTAKVALVGMIGGISIYGLFYLIVPNRDLAHSGLFLFLALFSTLILLQTYGIDLLVTKRLYRRKMIIALWLLSITLAPVLLFAATFKFVLPPIYLLIVETGIFITALIGMKLSKG